MYLTRHKTRDVPRSALDGKYFYESATLGQFCQQSLAQMRNLLADQKMDTTAKGLLLPPIEANQEVWGAGSRVAGSGCVCPFDSMRQLSIRLNVIRNGSTVFESETSTSQIKRTLEELVEYLFRELDFPFGCFLMTGTGIITTDTFTLHAGDRLWEN